MVRLGDVCTINPRIKTFQDDFMVSFVPMQNVSEEGTVDASIIKYYGEVKKGFTYFQENDVLFAKITPCMENGKGGIARNLKNGVAFGSTEFHVLRPNPNFMISSWLYYLTSWPEFRKECEKNMTGSAGQKRVPKTFLENYEIQLPELDEQRKIAAVLDKVSDLIAKRRQQLDKLDELIKARFVEMFGEPHENPKHWQEDELSHHLKVIGGYAFKSDGFTDEGIPVLRIGNINSGRFLPVNMVYWSDDSALARYKVFPGDLVMSLTGTVGKDDYGNVCILGADYDEYYLNQRNAKLSIEAALNKCYFSELLKFPRIKKRLTGISRGVRQANISNKDILTLRVPIPPIELQEQFAAFVEQTEKTKTTISESLEKLETLKKALMQEYFG